MSKMLKEKGIIIEELQGDVLTPIAIYQRLEGRKKFLLESSLKHENSGRYSFIGANPAFELKGTSEGSQIVAGSNYGTVTKKPLEVLKSLLPEDLRTQYEDIPFIGGAVGFVGYDVIRHYEEIGEAPRDELNMPDVHFMVFEEIVVYDHLKQKVYLVGIPLLEKTTIKELSKRLSRTKMQIENGKETEEGSVRISSYESAMTKEMFIEKVKKAKEYIVEGDIFQVVLSQRMKAEIEGDAFSFYRKLRIQNPSPYMYYIDFKDYVIAGASPESLIKSKGNKVITNPIAGTRPRGKSPAVDAELEAELLRDEKELAEHRMLVDLGRNDPGRVCKFGTVQPDKYMKIEKYKHVMHTVSEVSGELMEEQTPVDALISCLPAGTVSGAPKIRAMEIINELEGLKRGVYSGAVGYLSANGSMDFALAIRTMLIKGRNAYIQAGAGIVYDSIPEKEFEETLHKLRAFLEAEK